MSKRIILIWGFLIVGLVLGIYIIAITNEEEIKYISKKNELKEVVKDYIEDNKITRFPFTITTEELEEKDYLKEVKVDDKTCAVDITVNKKFIFYSYKMKFTCISTKENDET